MACLGVAVLLRLALGALVVTFQTLRISHEKEELETMTSGKSICCKIIEGTLYDSTFQNKKCKQAMYNKKTAGLSPCITGKYEGRGEGRSNLSHLDVLKVETLDNKLCRNAPWCSELTFPKCYKITEGELTPWHYDHVSFSQQEFPSGMAVSVTGKICQRSESMEGPQTYTHGDGSRSAKLEIKAVEMLEPGKCSNKASPMQKFLWKHHGLEAAPECDDFGFWKQVLSTEGIKAPNWEASIAAAKASSLEGMAWGTTLSDGKAAAKDSLWNARRDSILGVDDDLTSWS